MWWIITLMWNHGFPILDEIADKVCGIDQKSVRGHDLTIVKCMELSTSTKTLVVRINPLVTQTDEINYHHRIIGKCAAFVQVSHMNM